MNRQQALTELSCIKAELKIAKIGCRPRAKEMIDKIIDERIKRLRQWLKVKGENYDKRRTFTMVQR